MSESFDKKIKDSLSAHRPEADPAEIWQAILPEVDAINARQRKRRRIFFWWFLFAGSGMLLAGVVWWLQQPVPSDIAAQPTAQTEVSAKTEVPAKMPSAAEAAADTAVAKAIIAPPSAPSYQAPALENAAEEAEQTKSAVPPPPRPRGPQVSSANIRPAAPLPAAAAKLTAEPKALPLEVLPAAPLAGADESGNRQATTAEDQKHLNPILALLPTLDFPLPLRPLGLSPDWEETAPPKRRKKRGPVLKFQAGLIAGGGLSARQLTAREPDATNLLDLREETERSLEVVSLGFRLGAKHRTGLGFQTGLQLSRMAEHMEFADQLVRQDSVYGIQALAVNPYGDTTAIYGSVPLTTTTNIRKEYYNYYRFLDIPILLSYERQYGQWAFGAQAGVFLNLALKTKGQIFDVDYQGQDLAAQQPELFRSRVGLSYQLGLRAAYQIRPGWQLAVLPQLRWLPSISAEGYPLEQRHRWLGVQAGVFVGW